MGRVRGDATAAAVVSAEIETEIITVVWNINDLTHTSATEPRKTEGGEEGEGSTQVTRWLISAEEWNLE